MTNHRFENGVPVAKRVVYGIIRGNFSELRPSLERLKTMTGQVKHLMSSSIIRITGEDPVKTPDDGHYAEGVKVVRRQTVHIDIKGGDSSIRCITLVLDEVRSVVHGRAWTVRKVFFPSEYSTVQGLATDMWHL